MENQIATVGRLYSVLIGQPKPILLLGAGTSLKSGIPLAAGVVETAAKWAYALEHSRSPEDPRLQRSDWFPWLREKPWYNRDLGAAENYHAVVEQLLQPRQNRWEFFMRLINPGVEPSIGYEKLAEFLHIGFITTILTTNFDHSLPDVQTKLRHPHVLTLIQTEAEHANISTSPSFPQLVYIHGSVERYTDLNILEEVQRLHPVLVQRLIPLLRDHPLIVVGYRGGEPSVMEHLLKENVAEMNNFRHGVYWCVLKSDPQITPLTSKFADAIGRNFHLVPIDGFDELVANDLWSLYQQSGPAIANVDVGVSQIALSFDMQPLNDLEPDVLQYATLRDRLVLYCRRLDIRIPNNVAQSWVTDQAIRQNLLVRLSDETVRPTVAGYMLFGPSDQKRIQRRVTVRISGTAAWIEKLFASESAGSLDPKSDTESGSTIRSIEGNLWNQLDQIITTLAMFNAPFRLKGDVSQEVQPYPPLALKEVIVNALVHRDYQQGGDVLVHIEPSFIRITNPGGLVDEVRHQLADTSIQDRIASGKRGIKGYRNPVIADLFYGGGAMDKAGSGLSDVHRLVSDSGGLVEFGPSSDNTTFVVTIYCRPEAVDDVTKTARPRPAKLTRYAANVLEVLQLPRMVFHAATEARTYSEVWAFSKDNKRIPPFIINNRRVYSFHDPEEPDGPMKGIVDVNSTESLNLEEFVALEEGKRWLAWLLNETLYDHLRSRNLFVDPKRKRAFFTREDEGARQITYQGRLRRATRTVVKARSSSATGKIRYWEHKALGFRFEWFGATVGLTLVPGYVFTWDGLHGLLAPEKVTRLSTRRSARDYNIAVQSDLYFWAWVLSGGSNEPFWLDGDQAIAEHVVMPEQRVRPTATKILRNGVLIAAEFPTIGVTESESEFGTEKPDTFSEDLADLDEELSTLAEEAIESQDLMKEDSPDVP